MEIEAGGHTTLVCLGVRDVYECWQISVMIKHGMHFDSALGFAEFRPREEGETEFYRSRIHAVELRFETEFVRWSPGSTKGVHFGEQVFEKGYGTGPVGIGNCGTGDCTQPQVIEAPTDRLETAQGDTERSSRCQLNECHDCELLLES